MATTQTDDLRIANIAPLISPAVLFHQLPVSEAAAQVVSSARQEAEAILSGHDDRLLVVVGPCSIHDPSAALEYAQLLKESATHYQKDLLIIMRVYFEKPRTTVGWKGLINDPALDNSFDINRGLRSARELLLQLAEMGVPAGSEFLDAISPQYLADLISWGAIGARTTESQVHRELTSGLSMPVGFKNGTGGSVQIALDAISASSKPHHFLSVTKQGVSAIVTTTGNPACHLILRGGQNGPNYSREDISPISSKLSELGLPPHLMIDCSHGNSNKDYRNQPKVAANLCEQITSGSRDIAAVMLESHLVEGSQKISKHMTYGQSITDACLSWASTQDVLKTFSQAVQARREQK